MQLTEHLALKTYIRKKKKFQINISASAKETGKERAKTHTNLKTAQQKK